MSEKRFSPSCENNRKPIIEQLKIYLKNASHLLEIGSGTGQHGVYFAPELPHLTWQTSDVAENHPSILAWIEDEAISNIRVPHVFKVGEDDWPPGVFDAVYSANTAHIMQKQEVLLMMQLVAAKLPNNGVFCQYGPFTESGEFSSDSNADFHHHLVSEGYGGYRDIEELKAWVEPSGLLLLEKITMPANNLLLVWSKNKSTRK